MSPNMFSQTITSNLCGSITRSMAVASMIRSSNSTRPSYSLAISRPMSRKRPCVYLRMLALCASVTFLRPCDRAYSKA
jgi:hypothetical protein